MGCACTNKSCARRRVVRRLLLFSRFPVGTGGGNCVTIGLFNVRFRVDDVEVDKTSSIDRFSVFRTVFFVGCCCCCSSSSPLQINLSNRNGQSVSFLTNQLMQ